MTGQLEALLAGQQPALARVLSLLERRGPGADRLRAELRPHAGRALVVGITGPPGAGKSTLIASLIAKLRGRGERVAVLAVDPSSPVTGGAILGDRVRMGEHTTDEGVFIRSIGARGQPGGLARAVPAFIDAVDAAGWPVVLLETVGAGQSDVDLAGFADVAVLVCAPGLGDDMQAMKAGMLELADVLVVSKCDLPAAERTARQLERMIALREPGEATVPVVRSSAANGTGIDRLVEAIRDASRSRGGALRLRRELQREAEAVFAQRLRAVTLESYCAAIQSGERTIEDVTAAVFHEALGTGSRDR